MLCGILIEFEALISYLDYHDVIVGTRAGESGLRVRRVQGGAVQRRARAGQVVRERGGELHVRWRQGPLRPREHMERLQGCQEPRRVRQPGL